MFQEIIEGIRGVFEPAAKLVDNVTTSDEERGQLKNQLRSIEAGVMAQSIDLAAKQIELEGRLLLAQGKAILADQTSRYWLQRSWRPLMMLVFTALTAFDAFGVIDMRPELILLMQIGVGGYIGGRTLEKTLPLTVDKLFGKPKKEVPKDG